MELVHFAISNYTACEMAIVGSTIQCDAEKPKYGSQERITAGSGHNVQHTCLVELVTCQNCKDSSTYKSYVQSLYED